MYLCDKTPLSPIDAAGITTHVASGVECRAISYSGHILGGEKRAGKFIFTLCMK